MQVKTDIVFTVFDDIIKTPNIKILELVSTKYFKDYKDLINMRKIKDKHRDFLHALLIKRRHENIFDELMIRPFNTRESYNYLHDNLPDIYTGDDYLEFAHALSLMSLRDDFTSIYVWDNVKDPRKSRELDKLYGTSTKISYIDGDFITRIKETKPTLIVINSLRYLKILLDEGLCKEKTILLPLYLYNFNIDKDGFNIRLKNADTDVIKQGGLFLSYLPKKGLSRAGFAEKELELMTRYDKADLTKK